MTTPPPESPTPVVTPTLEETRALANAASDEEIRALSQQILKSGQLGFDPATILKGVITDIALSATPPTLSILISGDTTTTVSNVRLLASYSPQVDDTVLIAKQGPDIVVLGHVADLSAYGTSGGAGGWNKATLAGGSHNGNSNGDVCYRRVLDHGSWKMQWRGGWNVSGTTMVSALSEDFRPTSRRSLLTARDAGGSNEVKIDFNTDGSVTLVGTTTTPSSANATGDISYGGGGGGGTTFNGVHGHIDSAGFGTSFDGDHSHGVDAGSHDHGFFGGSHTHPVSSPSWVSLHRVEYFL